MAFILIRDKIDGRRKKNRLIGKDEKKQGCKLSYGKKQSILWGGGWNWEGEGARLKWEGERGGYQVLPTALCLYFTGTIPECRLLIFRLPWHCVSWQLASLLPVPPVQERRQWIQELRCCQPWGSAPPPWLCTRVTFWPFTILALLD